MISTAHVHGLAGSHSIDDQDLQKIFATTPLQ